jgi:hypothetical protein
LVRAADHSGKFEDSARQLRLVKGRQKQVTEQLQNILPEQVPEDESESEFLADMIRNTVPPELLYHPDVHARPTTLYHVTRGVLLLLCRPFNQVRITSIPVRVLLGVARQMYDDEVAELALEMAESFFRNTSVQSLTTRQNQGAGVYNSRQSSENIGHRLGQRYSKVENKFTRGDFEDIILSLREYNRCANHIQATSEHRLQFLHNMFHGETKRIYLD